MTDSSQPASPALDDIQKAAPERATAEDVNPNAPKPATPVMSMLAVALLHTVPYSLSILFFYFMYAFATAGGMVRFIQSSAGALTATVSFAVALGAIFWSLFTLLSFWMDKLEKLLRLRHRAIAFLLLLPSFVLGPFYACSIIGLAAFKSRRKQLFIACLPGVVIGYFLLYGLLNILAGELAISWTNAILIPGLLIACAACAYVLIYRAADNSVRLPRWFLLTAGALHLVMLGVTVMCWVAAARAEAPFNAAIARLEEHFGRKFTNAELLSRYFHDDQKPTDAAASYLAQDIARGPYTTAAAKDSPRLPAICSRELLLLLDQADDSAAARQALQDWLAASEPVFAQMDDATQGPFYKDDLAARGGRYDNRTAIISCLNAWMCAYHARLHALLSTDAADAVDRALELLTHMTWLRDTALDDPYLLANGNVVILENRRLNAIQTLLASRRLNAAQLTQLADGLRGELPQWEGRTREAAWSALAWYLANVQNLNADSELGQNRSQSAFNDLVFGFAAPVHFWMLRADGAWTLDYYLQNMDKPYFTLMSLEDEKAFATTLPATATTAVNLVFPVRHQFIPLKVKQNALLIAIAVEQYRLRHGELPDSTARLVPEFLKELPKDDFSSGDFLYRQRTFTFSHEDAEHPEQLRQRDYDGYLVYSVSWDRVDNDGAGYVAPADDKPAEIPQQDLAVTVWNWRDLHETVVTKPDATTPDAANPDAAKPDATTPDAAKPDAAKPDTANPDAAKPDAPAPEQTKE